MWRRFRAESWSGNRSSFIFCYHDPESGDVRTFCVAQSTLADLATMEDFMPEVIFDIWRTRIYRAAEARMAVSNARALQNLSSADIRRAGASFLR